MSLKHNPAHPALTTFLARPFTCPIGGDHLHLALTCPSSASLRLPSVSSPLSSTSPFLPLLSLPAPLFLHCLSFTFVNTTCFFLLLSAFISSPSSAIFVSILTSTSLFFPLLFLSVHLSLHLQRCFFLSAFFSHFIPLPIFLLSLVLVSCAHFSPSFFPRTSAFIQSSPIQVFLAFLSCPTNFSPPLVPADTSVILSSLPLPSVFIFRRRIWPPSLPACRPIPPSNFQLPCPLFSLSLLVLLLVLVQTCGRCTEAG